MIHVSSPAATLNWHWSSPTPSLIQMQKNKERKENSVQIPLADIPSVSQRDCAGHRHNQYMLLGVKQPFDDRWGNSSHSDCFSHTLLISHSLFFPPFSALPICSFFLFSQFIWNLPSCGYLSLTAHVFVSVATGSPPNTSTPTVTALCELFVKVSWATLPLPPWRGEICQAVGQPFFHSSFQNRATSVCIMCWELRLGNWSKR